MASQFPSEFGVIVRFKMREDGGLIATCDKVPNFYLSHSSPEAVYADIIPALEAILTKMFGVQMEVVPLPAPEESVGRQMTMPALFGSGEQIYKGIPAS